MVMSDAPKIIEPNGVRVRHVLGSGVWRVRHSWHAAAATVYRIMAS